MVNKFKIGNRIIGDGYPCYIIAEIGCNHDGSLKQAKKLIDIAVNAGCDAAKFQSFTANKLFNEFWPNYKEGWISLLKKLELPKEWHSILAKYCKEKGIHFFTSVCDEEKVDWVTKIGVPVIKIPSYELTHLPLLKYIAHTDLPIIMSTGIAVEQEIQEALETIENEGNEQVAILHCVSAYPGGIEELNLKTIPYYKKRFGVLVGLSDHTPWVLSGAIAVALGANIVEKHITIDKTLSGLDHAFALDEGELKQMVKEIRNVEKAMGEIKCKPSLGEKNEIEWRRGLWAKRDIPVGKIIDSEDVMIVRPSPKGTLPPKEIYNVIGKEAISVIKQGKQISKDYLR